MILTMKEQSRIEVIQAIMYGKIEVKEGGKVLNRSVRQIFRMLLKLREEGLKGLQHGNKGKTSPRKIKKEIRKRILELARGKFKDINDTQLSEILLREEKINLSRPCLSTVG